MRYVILCLLLLFHVSLHAQTCLYRPQSSVYVHNFEDAASAIRNELSVFKNASVTLEAEYQRSTSYSKHYVFQVLKEGLPIHNGIVKVSCDAEGKILFMAYPPLMFERIQEKAPSHRAKDWDFQALKRFIEPYLNITSVQKIFPAYDIEESGFIECIQVEAFNPLYDHTYLLDMKGAVRKEYNNLRFLKKDTLIQVRVFNPDPLTKLQVSYGGTYIDNNDNADPWFVYAYDTMQVMAVFDTDSQKFYLENPWVILDDFDSPFYQVVSESDAECMYQRNEAGFEQGNILYHITHFHDYISSLGYDTLMNLQVKADAQGMFGGDNSAFNRNGGNPTLSFGTGGIDDGEDADVIIHEYCHGISWSANGNTNFSSERSGLDEGIADYFATSYSRQINPYNWQKVFSWDGNNGGWQGRTAVSTTLYPTVGIYKIGEVWNAAMSGIYTDLGPTITDKLMLEALHFLNNTSTLPEAAKYVLLADTLLFGGVHTNTICSRFTNQNILNAQCQFHTSTVEVEDTLPEIVFSNTAGFAMNQSPAVLTLSAELAKAKVYVLNIYGQTIHILQPDAHRNVMITPNTLMPGIYFLKVNANGKGTVFKLVKY